MPLGFKKKLEILILYFLLQVGKPSGETACTASNRYLLIGPRSTVERGGNGSLYPWLPRF